MDGNKRGIDILKRLLHFERERKFAEALYVLNPRDADNLIRWAEALFELSRVQNDDTKSREMLKDAISKLDKALSLNSENHYILWCLGNTYCSLAKLYPVGDTSGIMYFDRAYGYFKKALDKDPENKLYLCSNQLFQHNFGDYLKEMSDNNKAAKNPKSSNLMYEPYDTLGCVALAAVGIYALIHIAKSSVSPPPPR